MRSVIRRPLNLESDDFCFVAYLGFFSEPDKSQIKMFTFFLYFISRFSFIENKYQ